MWDKKNTKISSEVSICIYTNVTEIFTDKVAKITSNQRPQRLKDRP